MRLWSLRLCGLKERRQNHSVRQRNVTKMASQQMGGDQLTVKWIAAPREPNSFHTGPPRRDFPIFATFDSCVPPTVSWCGSKELLSPPLSFLKERKVRQTSHSGQKYISGSPQEITGGLFSGTFFFRCSIDLAFFWREAGAWAIFRHFLLEETSSEWVQWCGHWKSYLDHQSKERSRRFSLQVALEHTEQVSFLQVARVMLPAWWPLLPLLVLTCYLWPLGY